MAELEHRLTGSSQASRLKPELAGVIPDRRNYVLVVIDGLGADQLNSHSQIRALREAHLGTLATTFPSTTAVALSSISTGLTPLSHGVLGYLQWFPHLRQVGNLLSWKNTTTGQHLAVDPTGFLPTPNLWERLASHNILTCVYLPEELMSGSMTRMLYRGAETIPYRTPTDINPHHHTSSDNPTLIVVYTKQIDTAAHLTGQHSPQYHLAVEATNSLWARLARRLPPDTTLIGTADHGHIDIHPDGKFRLATSALRGTNWWGDNRTLMLGGPNATAQATHIARRTGAQLLTTSQLQHWLGTGTPHPELEQRLPDATLLAPPATVIYPYNIPTSMIGHHGGATTKEMLIPLLTGP
ncbi:MAG: alkaline phosphatase family protein [bacterium]|nr:alkaline phosphatase family protein [bacterium]MDE0234354.1 alkaline phosphatase family protein [bacterium]